MFKVTTTARFWAFAFLTLTLTTRVVFGQTERVLFTFASVNDGARPSGALVSDAAGDLYGSTISGGTGGQGVVFKLTRVGGGWVETVLHDFTGGSDGGYPQAPLALDAAGNVYGAANYGGGANLGVVFELSPSAGGWTETVLHSFGSGTGDAAAPYSGLVSDIEGNLYGTAPIASGGYGAVFELSPVTGGGWNYSIIHTFAGHTSDGAIPYSGLIVDPFGKLYGMTEAGGASGVGTVFAMTPSASGWNESVIYNFKGGSDGQSPFSNLTLGMPGHLYGMTLLGGTAGEGTVFELALVGGQWQEKVIHSFGSYTGDALEPVGTLVADSSGKLFGANAFGGAHNAGAVFELTPSGANWKEKLVYSFLRPRNTDPGAVDNVILDAAGNLYGVGPGGAKNAGVVFEVTP
jgi:uncharacterized repeat protein (TIGR03803 family)